MSTENNIPDVPGVTSEDLASMTSDLMSDLGQGGQSSAGSSAAGAPASPPAGGAASLPDPYQAPPRSWAKEYHGDYGQASPALRRYIHQREEEALRGITSYKKDAEFGTRLREKLQPFQQLLDQNNVDPIAAFDAVMRMHAGLTLGDDTVRNQYAQWAIKTYGLDKYLQAQAAAGQQPGTPPQSQEEVRQIKAQLEGVTSMIMEEKRQAIFKDIQSFASDPKNKYFGELYHDMLQLIRSGQAANISEAYEKSLWLNPSVREKHIADMAQGGQNRAPARPAQPETPLRSSSEPVTPAKSVGSIDDTLAEAYDRVMKG